MPKKLQTINDWSGGLNNAADKRDLKGNEAALLTHFDNYIIGSLSASKKFLDYSATIPDTGAIGGPHEDNQLGTGLFIFNNDWKYSDAAAKYPEGEYLVTTDAHNGNVRIHETGVGWTGTLISPGCEAPVFYTAEGDLYVGGHDGEDIPTYGTPEALMHHQQFRWRKADGTDSQSYGEKTVAKWELSVPQEKPAPIAGTNMDITEVLHSAGSPADAAGRSVLHWLISPLNADAADESGTWNNVHDGDDGDGLYYEYGGSFLYKNNTESRITYLGKHGGTSGQIGTATTWVNKAMYVAAHFDQDPTTFEHAVNSNIYGSRLYVRINGTSEWFRLAEMSHTRGISSAGSESWANWSTDISGVWGASGTNGFKCISTRIDAPPAITTWSILNEDHAQEELPAPGTYVKFGSAVIANGKAYVGNVEFDGIVHRDRVLKSNTYQYDRFFEDSFLDIGDNDGQNIRALEAYADRVLVFKERTTYIINVAGAEDMMEDVSYENGVESPKQVCRTPYGIAWINVNGCYLYNGENITQLQDKQLSNDSWSYDIDSESAIGYDSDRDALIIIHRTGKGLNTGYGFNFSSQSWYQHVTLHSTAENISNMVAGRDNKLYIRGGETTQRILVYTTIASALGQFNGADYRSPEMHLGNFANNKNLLKISLTYKYGGDIYVFILTENGDVQTVVANLTDVTGDTIHEEIDVSNIAALQGIKTFQLRLYSGISHGGFELKDITFTYRDLGTH